MVHTARAAPLRTACTPGPTPAPATRTTSRTSSASAASPTSAEIGSHRSSPSRSAYDVGSLGQRGPRGAAPASTDDDRQAREEHRHRAVRRDPGTARRRPVRPRAAGPLLDPRGGGAGPVLAVRHGAEHRGARGHLGVLAHVGPGAEHAARADPGAGADPDPPEVHHVAVDPEAAQVDLGLDRAARCRAAAGRSPAAGCAGRRRGRPRRRAAARTTVMYGAPASPVAPSSSTTRWASHSRRCTLPPRGWSPGSTRRSSARAPAAARSIRPGGVTKTSQPAASSHQDGWGSSVQPRVSASRRDPIPTQVSQYGPASARSSGGRDHLPDLRLERSRRDGPVRGAGRRPSSPSR